METSIITGRTKENRATILHERDRNNAIFGSTTFETDGAGEEVPRFWPATFISDIGGQMAATVTGPNTVKIADGVGFMEGVQWAVEELGQELTFPDYDLVDQEMAFLILAKYTRDSATGIEDIDLVVHKGGDDSIPYDGTIASGADFFYQSLYKVVIGRNGIAALTSGHWPDNIVDYLDSPVALGVHARPYMSQGERRQQEVKRLYETNADTNAFTDAEKTKLAELVTVLPCPHRIGDILETTNPAHPGTSWPGTTWAEFGTGRVTLPAAFADGVGVTGEIGGTANGQHSHTSAEHAHASAGHSHGVGTLTAAIRPTLGGFLRWIQRTAPVVYKAEYALDHGKSAATPSSPDETQGVAILGTTSSTVPGPTGSTTPGNSGVSDAMPPYITVYRWKRTG